MLLQVHNAKELKLKLETLKGHKEVAQRLRGSVESGERKMASVQQQMAAMDQQIQVRSRRRRGKTSDCTGLVSLPLSSAGSGSYDGVELRLRCLLFQPCRWQVVQPTEACAQLRQVFVLHRMILGWSHKL